MARKLLNRLIEAAAQKTGKPVKPLDDFEARTIASADTFRASRFMGMGQYEVRDFDTLDLALAFQELHPKERWMLYATKKNPEGGTSRAVLVTPLNLANARKLTEEKR